MAAHTDTDQPDEYALNEADHRRFADERARGMLAPQDPRLELPAAEIDPAQIASAQITSIVDHLYTVALGQRRKGREKGRRRTLVGLAAPQIGEPYRIVLIDTKVDESRRHYGKLECFINPVIVWRSRETAEGREGCFSAGPVWGLVRRPVAVKIRAYNQAGREVTRILEDFSARVACHEIDHLDGVRFPERILSDKKRHWVHTEELTVYPELATRWPRLCSLARWQEFKRGG